MCVCQLQQLAVGQGGAGDDEEGDDEDHDDIVIDSVCMYVYVVYKLGYCITDIIIF